MDILIHQKDLLRLAQIVRDETGNRVLENNYSMLESRIKSRLRQLKMTSIENYWNYFSNNERAEREILQSLMTTHYTFFFREYVHFEVLENWIHKNSQRLKARYLKNKKPLKVWSAGCSRGQEVYSLAMFLEVQLLKKFEVPYEIIGTDIDLESIEFARNGVYPIKEVTKIPTEYLQGNWRKGTGPIKDFASVHPRLREKIRFQPLNILEIDPHFVENNFDLIFCRNVFIYFSEENTTTIVNAMVQRLEKEAVFFSGVSEPLRIGQRDYETIGPSSYQFSAEKTEIKNRPPPIKEVALDKSYKVLCVDDSLTIQNVMKNIFSQDANCATIHFAENGRDARLKMDQYKYDVITLDIHMPVVNGIQFLETHYNKKIDPPVIVVSSVNRSDQDLASKALQLGAFDYVEKPELNRLKQSTAELLTKVALALKNTKSNQISKISDFDFSLSQKIVIPDPSKCLRIVFSDTKNRNNLESILMSQQAEQRSPPLVIACENQSQFQELKLAINSSTSLPVEYLSSVPKLLKAHTIYFIELKLIESLFSEIFFKSVSLQFLTKANFNFKILNQINELQILFDESLSKEASEFERLSSIECSDMTPATSFTSLSSEFFTKIRQKAS